MTCRSSRSIRSVRPVAAATVSALLAAAAAAQGPAFTTVPIGPPYQQPLTAISPDGRYVAGIMPQVTANRSFRYDRRTGGLLSLGSVLARTHTFVFDDGWVIGCTDFANDTQAFRWNPDSGAVVFAPATPSPGRIYTLDRASRDGLFAAGGVNAFFTDDLFALFSWAPGFPAVQDLRADNAAFRDDQVSIAGITQPIDGTRYVFGTLRFDGQPDNSGAIWTVGNPSPVRDDSVTEYIHISPRAEYKLVRVGSSIYIRGDGADRVLPAPISPFIMSNPVPRFINDDASVAVGGATAPGGAGESVVWRKGLNPTTLRAILEGAGVAVPTWTSSAITGISADGSVVAGRYAPASAGDSQFVAVLPAVNDNCQTARPVTYGTTISSTNGATRAGSAVPCASEGTAPDVWFSFLPAANESVTIDTCGSSFDTTLALFSVSCASIASPLACNDDANPPCSGSAVQSRVSASVFAGQTYYIRVSGWNGAYGSIQLNITAPARPANDACGGATQLAPASGIFFNNSNAITDARPNCPGTSTPFNDLWFRCTPNDSGRMTYSTCGSSINTVMAVYPGSACGDLNAAALACGQSNTACGGSPGTRLTVPCSAGESQLIRVGGYLGATGLGQFFPRFACDENVLDPYAVSVVNLNPRGYYRFDDTGTTTVADSMRSDPYSCGNYPGGYSGDVPRPGSRRGRALFLSGTGAHVVVPDLTHVTDPAACGDPEFGATLEAWINTTDPYAGVVLTNRTAPSEHSLTLVVGYNPIGIPGTAGRVLFVSDGPGTFFGGGSLRRVDDGRWHHIVGRRTTNSEGTIELQVWIDGVQEWYELPGVGFNYSGANGANWLIGNGTAWTTADAAFSGFIDDTAVYCGAMHPGAIANHFDLGRPPACDPDLNQDGNVDQDDIAYLINVVGGGENPTGIDPDFNQDGNVDQDDVASLINAVGGGGCP